MQLTINQRAWLHALRSGDFKQVTSKLRYERDIYGDEWDQEDADCGLSEKDLAEHNALHDGTGHCCLGVACSLADAFSDGLGDLDFEMVGDNLLNQDGLDWLGMTAKQQDEFAKLNDNRVYFTEIADIAEQMWRENWTDNRLAQECNEAVKMGTERHKKFLADLSEWAEAIATKKQWAVRQADGHIGFWYDEPITRADVTQEHICFPDGSSYVPADGTTILEREVPLNTPSEQWFDPLKDKH